MWMGLENIMLGESSGHESLHVTWLHFCKMSRLDMCLETVVAWGRVEGGLTATSFLGEHAENVLKLAVVGRFFFRLNRCVI